MSFQSVRNIFKQYQNIESWYTWDNDIQNANQDGNFVEGTRGQQQPTHGPISKFTLTEVTLEKSFTTESKLPLCSLLFEHTLEATDDGIQVTHRFTSKGY